MSPEIAQLILKKYFEGFKYLESIFREPKGALLQ